MNIAQARKAKGLSQYALAELLDSTQRQIHLYESGKREPRASMIVKMSDVLGVSVEYLLGIEEDEKESEEMPVNNIKKARLLAGLTQEDLAVALGTNRRQIHKLETGASDFRASTLLQLSDALGVSVAYILGIGLEDPTALSKEEARLLEMYRALSNEDKTVIERVVQALSQVQD